MVQYTVFSLHIRICTATVMQQTNYIGLEEKSSFSLLVFLDNVATRLQGKTDPWFTGVIFST